MATTGGWRARILSRAATVGVWIPFILTACASAGGGESVPRVPVFFSEEAVPCAYETVGRVTAGVYVERRPDDQMRRVLGEAGARAGGDGVLVPDEERSKAVALVVRGPARTSSSAGSTRASAAPRSNPVSGWLLIYTDETCKTPPSGGQDAL
jgi:hypothetical protein